MSRYNTTTPQNLPQDDDVLVSFLETSRNLLDIIRIESEIFEKNGQFTLENFRKQKAVLLKSFEDKATQIMHTLNEDANISTDKIILLEEIKAIQSALQANTQYHFRSLSAHLKSQKTSDEVSSWH